MKDLQLYHLSMLVGARMGSMGLKYLDSSLPYPVAHHCPPPMWGKGNPHRVEQNYLPNDIFNSLSINVYDFIFRKQQKSFTKKIHLNIFIKLCFKCS